VSDDAAAEDTGKGKKGKKGKDKGGGKSNLVPAIVLAVGIAAGGYFMGGSGEAAHSGEAATTTMPAGEIVTMEPISVNLADGHFLKVGLGVQLSEAGNAEEFPKGPMAKVKDMLIDQLAGANMAELATKEGKEKVKHELTERAKEEFEGEVLDFYFTDFVMQ